MNENYTHHGGFGLSTVLFIVFLVLKLTNTIDWSWLWVLSPLWIEFGVALIVVGIVWIVHRIRY